MTASSIVARCVSTLRRSAPKSLRARLVVVVIAIDCVAALLTGAVVAWKARTAERLEIASAMQLAESLVTDTIRLMQNAPAPVVLQSIDLHFQSVRHVRVAILDEAGRPVGKPANSEAQSDRNTNEAPAWFSRLVGNAVETKDFPIIVGHKHIGVVKISSEPADEIGEAWGYAHTLLVTAACLNVIVLAVLFVAFGRVLAPLTTLASALQNLEDKNYEVRLPHSSVVELATITDHFNKAAGALSAAQDANRQLNRRLIAAQDEERRRTALELHDEVGPCLFALEATATSIGTMTRGSPDMARVHERAKDLVTLVANVQSINRRVLDRLRPMALGRIPLRDSLFELLANSDLDENAPEIDQTIGSIRESYDRLVDLTLYRCVQEGVFNAVRHAHAEHVHVLVDEEQADDGRFIIIAIRDDGRGLPEAPRQGRGLAGIRERVEALAGSFDIKSLSPGTLLDIRIPIEAAEPAAPGPRKMTHA